MRTVSPTPTTQRADRVVHEEPWRSERRALVAIVDDVVLDRERANASAELRTCTSHPGCSARRSNRSMISSMSRSAVVGLASSAT